MGAKHINNRSLSENVIDNYMKLCPLFKHYNAQNISYPSVIWKIKGSKHLLLISLIQIMGVLILVNITINPLARCDKAQDIYLQSKSRYFYRFFNKLQIESNW